MGGSRHESCCGAALNSAAKQLIFSRGFVARGARNFSRREILHLASPQIWCGPGAELCTCPVACGGLGWGRSKFRARICRCRRLHLRLQLRVSLLLRRAAVRRSALRGVPVRVRLAVAVPARGPRAVGFRVAAPRPRGRAALPLAACPARAGRPARGARAGWCAARARRAACRARCVFAAWGRLTAKLEF